MIKIWEEEKFGSTTHKICYLLYARTYSSMPKVETAPYFKNALSTILRYKGTLFRFPFREKVREKEKAMSQKVYDDESINKLIHSLTVEGHLYLLFLKHLENIEFYVKENSASEPALVYQAVAKPKAKDKSFYDGRIVDKKSTHFLEISVRTKTREITKYQYLVSQLMRREIDVSLDGSIPVVGIAMPLHDFPDTSVTDGGQLFCFMPLPLERESPTGN